MLSGHALLASAAFYIAETYAQPRVAFPINAQLPPVAVADERFAFTFSEATFTSDLDITYTLGGSPSWLALDDTTRTLSGKPSTSNVGETQSEIIATDDDGNISTSFTLVVLDQSSLQPNQDVFVQQFAQAGNFSAPSTLLLYPETPFNLNFGRNVFEGEDDATQYYATSADNAPLPAWIAFDAGAVSFAGNTPSLLTPQSSPQTFTFALVASQILGFSQGMLDFQIAVTNHVLNFLEPEQQHNITAGEKLVISPLIQQLRRDGSQIDRSQIANTSSEHPGWLEFDSADLSFAGSAPVDANTVAFRLTVTDMDKNVAVAEIKLCVSGQQNSEPTQTYLGTVNATIGEHFNYSVPISSIHTAIQGVNLDIDDELSWLSFNEANATLNGQVPADAKGAALNVTLKIIEDGIPTDIDTLTIHVVPRADQANGTSYASSTSSSVPSATGIPNPDSPDNGGSGSHRWNLALIIALPILAFTAICLAIMLLLLRRRKKARPIAAASLPAMADHAANSSSSNIIILTDSQSQSDASSEPLPSSPPPRVDLPWSPRERPRNRHLSAVYDDHRDSPETRSSWEDMLLEVDPSTHFEREARSSPHTLTARLAEAVTEELTSSPKDTKPLLPGLNKPITEMPLRQRAGSYSIPQKFLGRRSSGLGHGANVRGQEVISQRMTFRPVPLSPLSEDSTFMNSGILSRQGTLPLSNVTDKSSESSTRQMRSTRQSSSASNESRYAAPLSDMDSSERASDMRRLRSDHSTETWDDDDWMTEGSGTRSGNWQARQRSGGRSLRSNGTFSDRSGTGQLIHGTSGPLPDLPSQGASFRTHVSGQSQSNSLRFI